MEDTWTRISLLAGIAVFCLVVVTGLVEDLAPLPLLGRATGAGLFSALLVRVSISIARSVVLECVQDGDESENTMEEETQP